MNPLLECSDNFSSGYSLSLFYIVVMKDTSWRIIC